jgi:outer membrane lipoprotein-sorting protein
MNLLRYSVMVLAATLATGSAVGQGKSHLDTVLAQMDAASAKFQSAESDFQWDFFERVTRSTSSQTGTIFFERQKGGTAMGAKIIKPDVRLLGYSGSLLQVFDPKANTLIRLAAKGNQGQYESFLTLGFGGSGSDLKKQWTIADQGMETIDGISCAKLDLVSTDQNVKTMFTHVTIWVDPARDISLKQEFYTPSEDKRTAFYKAIKLNAKVDKKQYTIKPDSKTQVTNR